MLEPYKSPEEQLPAVLRQIGIIQDDLASAASVHNMANVFVQNANSWPTSIIELSQDPKDSAKRKSLIENIQMVAAYLDQRDTPELVQDTDVIKQSIDALREEMLEREDLPEDLRRYVYSVIAEVDHQLAEYEITGVFDGTRASERIISAVSFLAANTESSKRSRLSKIWNWIFGAATIGAERAVSNGVDALMLPPSTP